MSGNTLDDDMPVRTMSIDYTGFDKFDDPRDGVGAIFDTIVELFAVVGLGVEGMSDGPFREDVPAGDAGAHDATREEVGQ